MCVHVHVHVCTGICGYLYAIPGLSVISLRAEDAVPWQPASAEDQRDAAGG